MVEDRFRITWPFGLHARPAANMVRLAERFDSAITIENAEGLCVNAKSIMGVMMLAAVCDSTLLVRATGADAAKAVETIGALISRDFDMEMRDGPDGPKPYSPHHPEYRETP
jgi:phosphocarrier protein